MCLMCCSRLLFSDGRTVEFEEEAASILGTSDRVTVMRGRVPRPDGGSDDAAIKIMSLEGLPDDRIKRAARDFEVEASRMRTLKGQSPFLTLIAADTDPQSPAQYTGPDGNPKKVLFIAMPPLLADYVELSRLIGWKSGELVENQYRLGIVAARYKEARKDDPRRALARLLADLKVMTKAPVITTQAHRTAVKHGIYCLDAFLNNVMLPRQALMCPDGVLERFPSVNGGIMIDLANTIAADTPGSPLPEDTPAFLGERPARVPLDQEAQEVNPAATIWFTSPEHWSLDLGYVPEPDGE
ncbi:unnamed protein product [Vitrella brassicaformis CCMP3155]|uniref:Uncharacterized protein n=1 Tax=Vitrella brassicaformis (strain CCMP3155) TaxID=1169540 RepID=A0A0G4ELG1_VITBC|nr:unnamed protein product [Vitrella brassicaformis CCMP3155]|eukprot:CEL97653.1 unnamed protein product [Vitrella brassicaformis CCMP3155]